MNHTKAIKRARQAIRQADNALKAADRSLRRQEPDKKPGDELPDFLAKTIKIPDEVHSLNGLADAAAMLRQRGPGAFKIGDEIEVTHRLGKLRFAVIGIDFDMAADREHTLTLMLASMVLGSVFDAPDLDNPFGRNIWHLSSIRAMLNSDFLDGFTEADQQAMTPTQHRTYSFTEREYIHTNDRIFLLSASEAGFEADGETIMNEGDVYPYFRAGSESRQLCDANGNARYWWLRSPHPWSGNYVRSVTPSGALINYGAYDGSAVAAVCVIG